MIIKGSATAMQLNISKFQEFILRYYSNKAFWLIVLTLYLYLLSKAVIPWPNPFPGMDGVNYMKMAIDPFNFFNTEILPHHAQRIFPSFVVWLLTKIGFSAFGGFYLLSRGLFLMWILGTFQIFSLLNIPASIGTCFCILLTSSYWAYPYPLSNIYQLNDLCAFAFAPAIIFFTLKKNYFWWMIVSLISVLSRQNLALLVFFSASYLCTSNFSFSNIIKVFAYAAPSFMGFLFSSICAGGGAVTILATVSTFKFDQAQTAFFHSDLVGICMPFLLWALNINGLKLFVKYWWVSLFALATILQPMGYYFNTGPANFQRIVVQGTWWLVFPAALGLLYLVKERILLQIIFSIMSLIFVLVKSGKFSLFEGQLKSLKPLFENTYYFSLLVVVVLLLTHFIQKLAASRTRIN